MTWLMDFWRCRRLIEQLPTEFFTAYLCWGWSALFLSLMQMTWDRPRRQERVQRQQAIFEHLPREGWAGLIHASATCRRTPGSPIPRCQLQSCSASRDQLERHGVAYLCRFKCGQCGLVIRNFRLVYCERHRTSIHLMTKQSWLWLICLMLGAKSHYRSQVFNSLDVR